MSLDQPLCSDCLDNGLVSPGPGILMPCGKCKNGEKMAENMKKTAESENKEIEVPCGFCGNEAKTPTGIHYIGKSIYDPGQKPACVECVKKHEELRKNRKIIFEYQENLSMPICKECYAVVMAGHEADHAKQAHQCDKWEILQK